MYGRVKPLAHYPVVSMAILLLLLFFCCAKASVIYEYSGPHGRRDSRRLTLERPVQVRSPFAQQQEGRYSEIVIYNFSHSDKILFALQTSSTAIIVFKCNNGSMYMLPPNQARYVVNLTRAHIIEVSHQVNAEYRKMLFDFYFESLADCSVKLIVSDNDHVEMTSCMMEYDGVGRRTAMSRAIDRAVEGPPSTSTPQDSAAISPGHRRNHSDKDASHLSSPSDAEELWSGWDAKFYLGGQSDIGSPQPDGDN